MKYDRFEKDLRSVVRESVPAQAPLTLRERLSTVADGPATRFSWFAPIVRWAAYLVIVAAVAGVAYLSLEQRQAGSTPAESSPTAPPVEQLLHLDLGRFEVDHPARWVFHEYVQTFSGYGSFGYLTTGRFDPDAICTRASNNSIACDFSGHPVEPGGVVVLFEHWGLPDGFGAGPGETPATVGGMPAYVSEARVGDTLTLTWRVRTPGGMYNGEGIEVKMREPGTDASRRQVEAMIASLRFDPAPTILPTSGPEFDRGAREAAAQALDTLRNVDSAGYACFVPPEPGVTRTAEVEVVPQNRRLSQP
ncbi:MAG: hypothetical protein ACRDFR_03330, partial [Candidatus Limnocylindria bacterium]